MWNAAKRTSAGTASILAGAAKNTLEQVSAAVQRVGGATGASVTTAFLVPLVADGAAKTFTAIAGVLARKWR